MYVSIPHGPSHVTCFVPDIFCTCFVCGGLYCTCVICVGKLCTCVICGLATGCLGNRVVIGHCVGAVLYGGGFGGSSPP